MDSKRWLRLKDIFRQAIELPVADRISFIASRCDDDLLRKELVKLLDIHQQDSDFLLPLNQFGMDHSSSVSDPMIGRCLNGFHILRRIGSGGMGIVYEARQENPSRMAAVKLLQPGCTTEKSFWRFENESEAQARVQHPGIATVYASGSFDFGHGSQPWFAMELIDGVPLHRYWRSHPIQTVEKLQMLLMICDAVQHAHERGVIHRDLKPANILVVTLPGDAGQVGMIASPKIVDFGLARMEARDLSATMHTATGDILGTLSYMSPERFAGGRGAIDTRCDVYALGTIGYEMLAGCLPHDPRSSSVAEAIRCIEQDDPVMLGLLNPNFRGDLEVIFAKAIAKELSQRYASVALFSADIRRFLNHQPVLARPPSLIYRMRKFTRRNRALVTGVAATILALTVGIVLVGREASRAVREASKSKYEVEKASAINDFVTNDFLMKLLLAAQTQGSADRLPVRDLVKQASSSISTMFANEPLLEAAVRNEVATIYYNLGEFEQAIEQFRLAMVNWEAALGSVHPDTLKAINNLGQCHLNLRQFEDAEYFLRRAFDGRLRVLGESDAQTLASMNNLASLMQQMKRFDEAERMFRRAIDLQEQSLGMEHKTTLASMANLGSALASSGEYVKALDLHQRVYDISKRSFGQENLSTLHAGSRLGQTLFLVGKKQEALNIVASVQESFERMHGPTHPDTIIARRLLARIHKSLGEFEAARNQLQIALDAALTRPDQFESMAKKLKTELKAIETASSAK